MGSGPVPMYADTITEKKLRSLVPKEFDGLIAALRADSNFVGYSSEDPELNESDEFILGEAVHDYLMWHKGPAKLDPKTQTAWRRLRSAFKKATGLTLFVGYYDSDLGGRYDEVEGVYWHVGGMYQLTEAGKKMSRFVKREHFVQVV